LRALLGVGMRACSLALHNDSTHETGTVGVVRVATLVGCS
jgi:hypothetical protein